MLDRVSFHLKLGLTRRALSYQFYRSRSPLAPASPARRNTSFALPSARQVRHPLPEAQRLKCSYPACDLHLLPTPPADLSCVHIIRRPRCFLRASEEVRVNPGADARSCSEERQSETHTAHTPCSFRRSLHRFRRGTSGGGKSSSRRTHRGPCWRGGTSRTTMNSSFKSQPSSFSPVQVSRRVRGMARVWC